MRYALGSVAHADAHAPQYASTPCRWILLSRLAVDRSCQAGPNTRCDDRSLCPGCGLSDRAAGDSVHALHDEARAFYVHFDFEISPTDPLHLMLLMKDARANWRLMLRD